MGRSGRLFLLLRPYALLFVANLVATFVASVMDGATFVLLIPFLRTLFGHDPLNVAGGSAVERLLAVVVGPLFAAGSPGAALRNVVLVLVAAMVIKNVLAYLASVSSVAIQENVVRDLRVRLFGHLQTLPLDFFQRTRGGQDRKSTRLNSSHGSISYAVFCWKQKKRYSLFFQTRRSARFRHMRRPLRERPGLCPPGSRY